MIFKRERSDFIKSLWNTDTGHFNLTSQLVYWSTVISRLRCRENLKRIKKLRFIFWKDPTRQNPPPPIYHKCPNFTAFFFWFRLESKNNNNNKKYCCANIL